MIDCHTHCMFSHDSTQNPEESILHAISLGANYLAFTDHCDKDCLYVETYKKRIKQIDLDGYFDLLPKLKEKYKDKIDIAVGIEFGYMKAACSDYLDVQKKYKTDITINSIHLVDFIDCYDKEFFFEKDKKVAYNDYIKAVRESIDAPYDYDVVAHLGYVSRYAPYEDRIFHYSEFKDGIDDILKALIEKGKALEINTSSKNSGYPTLPNIEILKQYKAMGGELLTFGSDAHSIDRLFDKYQEVESLVKDLGFKYLFKYLDHKPIPIKL